MKNLKNNIARVRVITRLRAIGLSNEEISIVVNSTTGGKNMIKAEALNVT